MPHGNDVLGVLIDDPGPIRSRRIEVRAAITATAAGVAALLAGRSARPARPPRPACHARRCAARPDPGRAGAHPLVAAAAVGSAALLLIAVQVPGAQPGRRLPAAAAASVGIAAAGTVAAGGTHSSSPSTSAARSAHRRPGRSRPGAVSARGPGPPAVRGSARMSISTISPSATVNANTAAGRPLIVDTMPAPPLTTANLDPSPAARNDPACPATSAAPRTSFEPGPPVSTRSRASGCSSATNPAKSPPRAAAIQASTIWRCRMRGRVARWAPRPGPAAGPGWPVAELRPSSAPASARSPRTASRTCRAARTRAAPRDRAPPARPAARGPPSRRAHPARPGRPPRRTPRPGRAPARPAGPPAGSPASAACSGTAARRSS